VNIFWLILRGKLTHGLTCSWIVVVASLAWNELKCRIHRRPKQLTNSWSEKDKTSLMDTCGFLSLGSNFSLNSIRHLICLIGYYGLGAKCSLISQFIVFTFPCNKYRVMGPPFWWSVAIFIVDGFPLPLYVFNGSCGHSPALSCRCLWLWWCWWELL
jgi:hypothetical protein